MSRKIQSKPSLQHWHVFHKGLIKILVSHYLNKIGRTWDEFIKVEGFEGMNISRMKGRPPKKPRKPSVNSEPSSVTRHFPKPTSTTFRGKAHFHVPTVSKEVTPNSKIMLPSSKSSSFRRVTRSQGNKLSLGLEASFIGIKEQRHPWKKRLRTWNELVSKPNHHESVIVSNEAKGIGEPILGSHSISSPSSHERK